MKRRTDRLSARESVTRHFKNWDFIHVIQARYQLTNHHRSHCHRRASVSIMNLRDGRLLSLCGTVNPSRTAIHLPQHGRVESYIRLRFSGDLPLAVARTKASRSLSVPRADGRQREFCGRNYPELESNARPSIAGNRRAVLEFCERSSRLFARAMPWLLRLFPPRDASLLWFAGRRSA